MYLNKKGIYLFILACFSPIVAFLGFGIKIGNVYVLENCHNIDSMGYQGVALWPCIFLAGNMLDDPEVINHELIHIEQQRECFVIFFYLFYIVECLCRGSGGYLHISFEREAFEHQKTENYSEKRNNFAWIKYLKK